MFICPLVSDKALLKLTLAVHCGQKVAVWGPDLVPVLTVNSATNLQLIKFPKPTDSQSVLGIWGLRPVDNPALDMDHNMNMNSQKNDVIYIFYEVRYEHFQGLFYAHIDRQIII